MRANFLPAPMRASVFFLFSVAFAGCGGCGEGDQVSMVRCDNDHVEGDTQPCQSAGNPVGVGECRGGIQTCHSGYWGACEDEVKPASEMCNGRDDDCDNAVDEGGNGCGGVCDLPTLGTPCDGTDADWCADDTFVCEGPNAVACAAGVDNGEVCNNADEDCDGQIDEDVLSRCLTSCGDGVKTCTNGSWGECLPIGVPAESCVEVCYRKVTAVAFLDDSGSMGKYKSASREALDAVALVLLENEAVSMGLVQYPGDHLPDGHRWFFQTFPSITDATGFRQAVLGIESGGDDFEPTYDVLGHFSNGALRDVPWPLDTELYVFILITDERATQSENADTSTEFELLRQQIADQVRNCTLPGCLPGESILVIVVTKAEFFPQYDGITAASDRIELIEPAYGMAPQSFRQALTDRLRNLGRCDP